MYCTYTHTRLRLFAVALALIACAARASPEVLHLNCIPSAQVVDARQTRRFTERVWLRQTRGHNWDFEVCNSTVLYRLAC